MDCGLSPRSVSGPAQARAEGLTAHFPARSTRAVRRAELALGGAVKPPLQRVASDQGQQPYQGDETVRGERG